MRQWNTEIRQLLEQIQDIQKKKTEQAEQQENEIKRFFAMNVLPAFSLLQQELKEYEREATIGEGKEHASFLVTYQDTREFEAWIFVEPSSADVLFPFIRVNHPARTLPGGRVYEQEYFYEAQKRKTITHLSMEDILQRLAQEYTLHLRHLLVYASADLG